MSGRVPPSSAARRRRASVSGLDSEARRAALRYERFTGHDVNHAEALEVPWLKRNTAVTVIGKLDAVLYTTVRDGVVERYKHDFAAVDAPLLCVDASGRQLFVMGGAYDFTEKGIVDASDAKNSPRRRRR